MAKSLSDEELSTALHLQDLVEGLLLTLKAENPNEPFDTIEKILVILKKRDIKSFCKIKQQLIVGLKMVYDHEQDTPDINEQSDDIFEFIEQNKVFNTKSEKNY